MKRSLCLTLALLFLGLAGCTQKDDLQNPEACYYLRSETDYIFGVSDGIIAFELKENSYDSLEQFLNVYLSGPESKDLRNPFPTGSKIVSATETDSVVFLILTDSFASLSGMDLTLASACLAKTCFEATSCSAVRISAESAQLNNAPFMLIDKETFSFYDEGMPSTTNEASD